MENKGFSSKWTETPFLRWRRKQFVHFCRNSSSKNLTFFRPKTEKSYQTTFYARIILLLKLYCRQVESSFVETAENFPTTVRDFSTNILWFYHFHSFFPKLDFFTNCSSGHLECSFDNTAKRSLKKTDEVSPWIRQIMKIYTNFQNQSFCSKIGTHNFFPFRHVESSLYNCAGSSFAKTLRVCARWQKKVLINLSLANAAFHQKVTRR